MKLNIKYEYINKRNKIVKDIIKNVFLKLRILFFSKLSFYILMFSLSYLIFNYIPNLKLNIIEYIISLIFFAILELYFAIKSLSYALDYPKFTLQKLEKSFKEKEDYIREKLLKELKELDVNIIMHLENKNIKIEDVDIIQFQSNKK